MSIIKTRRKELRYSQEQIAQLVGMTQGAVSQWERLATVPRPTELFKLRDLLGVSIERILQDYVPTNGKTQDAA